MKAKAAQTHSLNPTYMKALQMDELLKDVPLVENEQSGSQSQPDLPKHQSCDHAERFETEYDENGNEIEVKTEFNIQDWKHACRSCRDMNSIVTAQQFPKGEGRKRSTNKYQPNIAVKA